MELLQDIFRAFSRGDRAFLAGYDVSGRISIPICITAAAAVLVSGIGTDLQATTRANDCLTAPNASSPRGQHWYYHMDLPNNRKCWYLHAPLMHRAAKASESHAVFTAADTPVSGSRADSAPRLPHGRILSVKPQPTSFVSAKSIQRGDPPWVPQENVPQGNALQVDGSKPTDAVATSSPAAAKPIEQSDASSFPQQNVPQESTLQVDGSKLTDAAATSSAAKPIEQSDASSIPQQNVPQESTLQVDGSKPTDAAATSSAVKPIEQSDAPSIPQENKSQESTLQVGGYKSTDAVVASSPATATFGVAGADSAPSDANYEAFDDGGPIAERSNPTTKADIVRGLSFKPVQIFLLLVFGVAIVFLISLMIIVRHRVTALIDFQLDHERPEAQAKHGWQDDRADARSPQMFVDNRRGQDGIDSPPWGKQPSVKRPRDRDATSTEPPRPSLEDVKAAPEHFKAALIYENRTQNRDYTFMYAPSWARRKPPMVAAHETSIEQPPQGHVVDAARSTFSGDLAVEDLRRRHSLTPEIIPEPKSLKGDHTRALIALRLSGVTAIAALIAWVVVSLPAMHRQPGNDNVHTAILPNPADGEQDQLSTATAKSPLNDRRPQANEPRANGGSEERQSGMTTVMAGPVTDAFVPATASPSTGSRLERTTVQPDEEEISALIKLAQGFLSNRDISSARLLLRRAAEAGSAAAALSLGETFDPLVIRQLHAIGVQPDPAKAREWYERAAQLGSDAASQHLAKLAQSTQ